MKKKDDNLVGGSPSDSAAAFQSMLAEHPFLSGLNAHQRRVLSNCAMVSHFEPGDLIFGQGDPANRFYLIHRGKVALESHLRGGGTVLIDSLGAGDVLGWSWLFPPYYWQFDARVIEPTVAMFFYGTPLREECEADHDLGYELVKRMSEVVIRRLQATRRQLLELHEKGQTQVTD